MEVAVLDKTGKDTGRKAKLSDDVFAIKPSHHAVYLDVKQYLANQRQGTHKSKERSEIVGSTRKLKKQKGTGSARSGSIKSGVFRGGARIFGPKPRDYSIKLNKQVKRLARKSALSLKAEGASVIVLEDFDLETPKTRDFITILRALNLEDQKSLFILGGSNKNVYLSSRNLQHCEVLNSLELSTYRIMSAKKIVFLESALERVHTNLCN